MPIPTRAPMRSWRRTSVGSAGSHRPSSEAPAGGLASAFGASGEASAAPTLAGAAAAQSPGGSYRCVGQARMATCQPPSVASARRRWGLSRRDRLRNRHGPPESGGRTRRDPRRAGRGRRRASRLRDHGTRGRQGTRAARARYWRPLRSSTPARRFHARQRGGFAVYARLPDLIRRARLVLRRHVLTLIGSAVEPVRTEIRYTDPHGASSPRVRHCLSGNDARSLVRWMRGRRGTLNAVDRVSDGCLSREFRGAIQAYRRL